MSREKIELFVGPPIDASIRDSFLKNFCSSDLEAFGPAQAEINSRGIPTAIKQKWIVLWSEPIHGLKGNDSDERIKCFEDWWTSFSNRTLPIIEKDISRQLQILQNFINRQT